MAVLLVAAFPILLLISSPLAWGGMAVGILLLYLDNSQQGLALRRLSVAPGVFRRHVRGQIRRVRPTVRERDHRLTGRQAEVA
jgi:hypothetical protein